MKKINIKEIIEVFSENRLKIILILLGCKENICGCDLVEKLGIPKNLVSYHVHFLESKGFIKEARCGRRKNYTLTEKGVKLAQKLESLKELI